MKRGMVLLVTIIMLLGFSACQKTSNEDFVVKKDTERMVEQAGAQENGTPTSALDIPKGRYTYEAADASGKVHIHVDAVIVLPDVERLPIVRVGMGKFTERDVENLYNCLCLNATPVSSGAIQPKGYYRLILDELTEMRQNGKLDKYDSIEELDAAIKEVMNDMEKAPEHAEAIAPDFSFTRLDDSLSEARILCVMDDSIMSDLLVLKKSDNIGGGYAEYIRDVARRAEFSRNTADGLGATFAFTETQHEKFAAPAISEQEALNTASNVITALGLTDFSCTGKRMAALFNPLIDGENEERKGLYEFMFTRSIAGVSITYTNDDIAADPESPNSVAKPWMYEKIRIFVDDTGVFALVWNAPYAVGELVNESATLLNFDEIKTIFERMIVVKNEQFGDTGSIAGVRIIEVKQIRLGLARVIEKDNNANAVLVPVWDFFGTDTYGGMIVGLDGYQTLLTINAVDGSIIDRDLGY